MSGEKLPRVKSLTVLEAINNFQSNFWQIDDVCILQAFLTHFVCPSLPRTSSCTHFIVFYSFRLRPPKLLHPQGHIYTDLFYINPLIDWFRQRQKFLHEDIPLLHLSLNRKSHYLNPNETLSGGGILKQTGQLASHLGGGGD